MIRPPPFRRCVVLGFQEALLRQVQDLAELLGDDWAWVRSVLITRPRGS